jgi:hypothetical protein
MSVFDGLRNAVVEILRPGTRQQLGERAVLQEMYASTNAQAILPNTWYRLHNQAGNCAGFSFVCNCRHEYQLLSAYEWLRDYKCKVCGAKFDLLKHVGATRETPAGELENYLAKLPIRPRLAGGPAQPNFIDTWGGKDDEVGYEMSDPGGLPRR